MNLKAILYDFDGTTVNTEKLHFDTWNETLSIFDISLEEQFYLNNYAGIPTPQNAETIIGLHKLDISKNELIKSRQEKLISKLKNYKAEYMPFALESIDFFKSKNIELGIVTGSPKVNIDKIFTDKKVSSKFNFIITRDDVSKSKPNAESYLLAIKKLNLKANEIIVLEDTYNGIMSAKSAGLICYCIQDNIDSHDRLKIADKIFRNLNEAKEYIENEIL